MSVSAGVASNDPEAASNKTSMHVGHARFSLLLLMVANMFETTNQLSFTAHAALQAVGRDDAV